MPKKLEEASACEKIRLLSKNYLSTTEMQKITGLGRNLIYDLKRRIDDENARDGFYKSKFTLTADFIKYANINVNAIAKMAKIEKQLMN